MQETERMQKHKNDLIFKLEGKTSAMAETLHKLDDKYVDFSLMSCFKIVFLLSTWFKGQSQNYYKLENSDDSLDWNICSRYKRPGHKYS